jgi:hypothetical protein
MGAIEESDMADEVQYSLNWQPAEQQHQEWIVVA